MENLDAVDKPPVERFFFTQEDGKVKGFYSSRVGKVPEGSHEISIEEHRAAMEAQQSGLYLQVIDGVITPTRTDPTPLSLTDLAARQRREIDAARDAAFAAGMPYTLPDGSNDVVQTRPQDQTNLISMSVKAERLVADGVTDPVMPFRGEKNVDHLLAPADMVAMTDAAQAHILAIYQQSWARKDAIDAALAAKDREGIEAVVW